MEEWEINPDQLIASKSIHKWTCLRSLDLRRSSARNLPKSIGQLLHLRSLDLSLNYNLKFLPESITKLVNLQALNLYRCHRLKQLPDDVVKLVDLSTLNIGECMELSCMPTCIGMLTSLHTLNQFVVGVRPSPTSKQCFYGLVNLRPLNKLKGRLEIQLAVLKNSKFVKEEHGGGGYLKSKEHLETIVCNFKRGEKYGNKESEQALMQEMQPHRGIKTLELYGYHGETIPIWPGSGDNWTLFDLPNLVTLKIQDCSELVYLPWQIGTLPHLKTLCISGSSFFPSLDNLTIHNLPRLKGWWRRSELGSHVVNPDVKWVILSPCFPLLKNLTIKYCEKMMSVLLCPQLENLEIYFSSKDMRCTCTSRHQSVVSYPKLKELETDNLEWLKSMPIKYTQFLVKIVINGDERMESLEEVTELFPSSLLSSLRWLTIQGCLKLKSMEGWLEHLSTLEDLCIVDCPKVVLGGLSWDNLAGTLNSLRLSGLEEMEELPEGIQYCTSLTVLDVLRCPKLKSVPKWMPKLTSLQELTLGRCSTSLYERCQKPNGEDWPLIQHISFVHVR